MQPPSRKQQGAAILLAMLIMALLASLASMALSKHWLQERTSRIVQQTLQHEALLTAGQQWAQTILIEDARGPKIDHLQEAWAAPMPAAPLAAFLGKSNTPETRDGPDAHVSVRIDDLMGRWNILSLRRAPERSQHFELARRIALEAGFPADKFIRLVDAAPPERASNWFGGSSALRAPQGPEACLLWLGLTHAEIVRLRSMVTCLPDETALNLNTVPPQFFAWLFGPDIAENAIKERNERPFDSIADAANRLKVSPATFPLFLFGHPSIGWTTTSAWFAIRTEVEVDGIPWQTTQTVQRLGTYIQTLSTTNEF